MLSSTQVMYTRALPNLNPWAGRHTGYGQRRSFPYYSVYFDDTWHVKPTFTFNLRVGLEPGDAAL